MPFDLYVWQAPRDLDADRAAALVDEWQAQGGDPAQSPFQPSTDMGWFHRELMSDAPGLEIVSDAVPSTSTRPIVLSTTDEPPARVVAIRLTPATTPDDLEDVFALAAKYDLLLFDARSRRLHQPLDAMAAHASATFWPRGAIQAGVAGGLGAVIAIVAWLMAIPVISWILVLVGGFMAVMAVLTFVHEGRKLLRSRRVDGDPPTR